MHMRVQHTCCRHRHQRTLEERLAWSDKSDSQTHVIAAQRPAVPRRAQRTGSNTVHVAIHCDRRDGGTSKQKGVMTQPVVPTQAR